MASPYLFMGLYIMLFDYLATRAWRQAQHTTGRELLPALLQIYCRKSYLWFSHPPLASALNPRDLAQRLWNTQPFGCKCLSGTNSQQLVEVGMSIPYFGLDSRPGMSIGRPTIARIVLDSYAEMRMREHLPV